MLALAVPFERRLDQLRIAVGATPGEWLDLHATQPATQFRDYQNHLLNQGCIDVGRALAERVVAVLPRHAAPAASSNAPS